MEQYYLIIKICIKLMLIVATTVAIIATTLPTCLLKFSTDHVLMTLYNVISLFFESGMITITAIVSFSRMRQVVR